MFYKKYLTSVLSALSCCGPVDGDCQIVVHYDLPFQDDIIAVVVVIWHCVVPLGVNLC